MLALLTMAASVPTRTLLFQNHQVSVTLEHTDAAHLNHLQITALPNQTTIERATIDAVTRETERILNASVPFGTTWHLQECPLPSFSIAASTLQWAISHHRSLNSLNRRLVVVLPVSKPWLNFVNAILRAFGPTCPTRVTADEEDAAEFTTFHP